MSYDPDNRHRRSIRLTDYDYSQVGAYFITICTYRRICLFGEIIAEEMRLNNFGLVVNEEWLRTASIRPEIELDVFQVMPNHLHGVVVITERSPDSKPVLNGRNVGAHGRAPLRRQPRSLGSLIAGFKSAATKRINDMRQTPGEPVWQRNYYEHIIRRQEDLDQIRQYILGNPAKWSEDPDNPHHLTAHGIFTP